MFAQLSTTDVTAARPEAVAADMRITSSVAAMLIGVALAIAVEARALLLKDGEARRAATAY